jgi:cobalt-zinc-cadmium efflux system outer membrane protein
MQQLVAALRAKCSARCAILAPLLAALLSACVAAPGQAPLQPADTLNAFSARRLEQLTPALPPPAQGWDPAQWLTAALQLNPQLAEERAQVTAAAAAERTAAEFANPSLDLFAEYLTSAAQSGAWLYGLSLDFLLHQPGERTRAKQHAALETALAQSDLAESIWQVRAALREALLTVVAARAESGLLQALRDERQRLCHSDEARLQLGDIARAQLLADQLELARVQQRLQAAQARAADATAQLAAAVGVPLSAVQGVPVRWDNWAAIDGLTGSTSPAWRSEALIARPQIVHALRAYDLAEISLQSEVAKRWPQVHVTPAYAWGGNGVREDALNDIDRESALGVSLELPIFNQHQGAIGEAVARRSAAGEHLKAVQAQIFAQIDRAELAWPAARQAWADVVQLADSAERQGQSAQHALEAGASERAGVLAAQIAATEAQLAVLQAAEGAQSAFGALEDAYRRPLEGAEPPAQAAGSRS